MNDMFASRIGNVGESRTTRIAALAQTMQRQGRQVISLAVGEPDFPTPEPIILATCKALNDRHTRYGPVAGEGFLRHQLAQAFEGYGAENIILTNGAKQALFSLFQVLCNDGDEVIVPRPCWVSFTEQIKLAGARPVLVDTGADFQIDPQTVWQAMTPRTRAIVINTPNNPTGAVYGMGPLSEVARIADRRRLYVIADEAYHAFTYDGRAHVRLFDITPDRQRVITVRSFSKQYNMTGFRIGYVAAARPVVQALARLQSHNTGNVCTFAQYGALAALKMDQAIVAKWRARLQRRRDLALALAAPLFKCAGAQGAFYLFADITSHLGKGETSEDLALRLLEKAGVAVVPGEAFHCPGHIRISYGADEQTLRQAFGRMAETL